MRTTFAMEFAGIGRTVVGDSDRGDPDRVSGVVLSKP